MENKNYAYLPEDLLLQMLEKAPATARQLAKNIDLNDSQVEEARKTLEDECFIKKCAEGGHVTSIMAADGANIIEHKTSADIILSIAVGVDGLSQGNSTAWPSNARQFQQWQIALPHHVANYRLAQGVMFLMELNILSETDREIRIMDGAHFTFILKLNSLLSAKDEEAADAPYVSALSEFLAESYEKVIPDIPDMINNAFSDRSIIALTKYSSSREIIDSKLTRLNVLADDKIFMSLLLREDEYTFPVSVGQSPKDKKMWNDIHIKCNLEIGTDNVELNDHLKNAISPLKTELFFCYYKPFSNAPAYRIELKKSLAENQDKFEEVLRSIKEQIIFPQIREPYPQYLADIIAKNISYGMGAVNQAICNDPFLNELKNFDLIFPYRT